MADSKVDKNTTVVDDNIGDYTIPQLCFRLGSAYADSSHQIVRSMLAGDMPKTFAHAQTMHFLFEHAVELFLKGAILKKRIVRLTTNTTLKRSTADTEISTAIRHLDSPFA